MARKFKMTQAGKSINVTLDAELSAGDILVSNGMALVAVTDGAVGETIAMDTEGVFEVTAKTADAFGVGTKAYWDSTSEEVTITATDNDLIGRATTVKAGATAGTVEIKINVA